MSCTASGRWARWRSAIRGDNSSTPEVLAPVWVLLSQSITAYSTSCAPLAGTSRFRRIAVYTGCLRCTGASRRPASDSVLLLPAPSRHAVLYDPGSPSVASLIPRYSISHLGIPCSLARTPVSGPSQKIQARGMFTTRLPPLWLFPSTPDCRTTFWSCPPTRTSSRVDCRVARRGAVGIGTVYILCSRRCGRFRVGPDGDVPSRVNASVSVSLYSPT